MEGLWYNGEIQTEAGAVCWRLPIILVNGAKSVKMPERSTYQSIVGSKGLNVILVVVQYLFTSARQLP